MSGFEPRFLRDLAMSGDPDFRRPILRKKFKLKNGETGLYYWPEVTRMRRIPLILRRRKLASTFILTAILLFAVGILASNAAAQQDAAPPAPEPPPSPVV